MLDGANSTGFGSRGNFVHCSNTILRRNSEHPMLGALEVTPLKLGIAMLKGKTAVVTGSGTNMPIDGGWTAQ
jgi:hypothetical protein